MKKLSFFGIGIKRSRHDKTLDVTFSECISLENIDHLNYEINSFYSVDSLIKEKLLIDFPKESVTGILDTPIFDDHFYSTASLGYFLLDDLNNSIYRRRFF